MDGWFPLGGLHVNGSFVCVGCVEKYDGDGRGGHTGTAPTVSFGQIRVE